MECKVGCSCCPCVVLAREMCDVRLGVVVALVSSRPGKYGM